MSTLRVTNIQNAGATNVAMVLDTAGTVKAYSTISVGNVTPAASGAGITFPATASASSDANTLDDYEEGTFTPTLLAGFSSGPSGYTTQTGAYIKIGRMVYFQIWLDAVGATGNATQVRIGGLPFTTSASSSSSVGFAAFAYNVGFTSNAGDYFGVGSSNTQIELYTNTGADRLGNAANVDINARIQVAGCYIAA